MKRAYINYLSFRGLLVLTLAGIMSLSVCGLKASDKGIDFAKDFEVIVASDEVFWPKPDLQKTFAQYWGLRFQGEVQDIYSLEAPYFQEMIHFGQYRNYLRRTGRNTLHKIEIFDIVQRSDHFVEISMKLHFEKENGQVTTSGRRDRWVRVQKEWFHVLRNPVIFPQVS